MCDLTHLRVRRLVGGCLEVGALAKGGQKDPQKSRVVWSVELCKNIYFMVCTVPA
jgi:hypothetical protein